MALTSWVWAVMVERQQRTQLPPAYGSGPGPEGGERGSSGDGPRDKRRAGAPRRGGRPALCFGGKTPRPPSRRWGGFRGEKPQRAGGGSRSGSRISTLL